MPKSTPPRKKKPKQPIPTPVTDTPATDTPVTDTPVADQPVASSGDETQQVRMPALIDQVTDATDAKRGEVKKIIEATMAAMGAAVERGDTMVLPGFGRLRVVKRTEGEAADVFTLRLRQKKTPVE